LIEGTNSTRIWFNIFIGALSGTLAFVISYRSDDEINEGLVVLAIIESLFAFILATVAVKYK
jgi:hypothetical protein